MDKHRKLRRYSRKDYSLLVDFPVEIVGRDGVVRRYTFEESIRLYQRRITSSNARYPDLEVANAEIAHCRQRIEQLRRSYFSRYGWASLRSSGALGLEEGLAGEVAAFLRRCLEGTDQDPESLRVSALADNEDPIVLYVQRSGAAEPPPPPNLLYVYRFPEQDPGAAREAFFSFLKILRSVRSHGMERGGGGVRFVEPGFNYRLTDFQAALGRAQLPHLTDWIAARRLLAARYRERLASLARGGRLVLPADDIGHSWQTFMVVLADGVARDAVIRQLAAQGIEANLGAQCVSAQPAFAAFAPRGGSAEALRLFRQGLALPFCERYGAAEVEQVARALTRVLEAV